MTIRILLKILAFLLINIAIKAQTPIAIPDTISGNSIDLYLKDSFQQFYTGINTATIGYNGSYLGPTIIMNKGQYITLNVHNQLNDTTTTHWHGLHVAPMNDGSPHNMIMAGTTWSPGFTCMDDATTDWYHPHLHMKTMKQVLKGAAGIIIIRDAVESALNLPRKYGIDDFPLVCQWKTFDANKQIVMDDALDNATMVNGNVNGYLNVPAQMVRLRLLNGSSHRFFQFAINDNRTFQQIGGDESLLNAPVSMNKLMLSPGERAEIIVDFSGQNGNTYYLKQLGTQLPAGYPGGTAVGMGSTPGPLDNTDFNLMQFNVIPATIGAITSLPSTLVNNIPISAFGAGTKTFLIQGSPMMSMTNFTINGAQYAESTINFTTKQDSVMIWDITNQSMMPHPWHIHGNHFYIQSINGVSPAANMLGKKDVVVIPPQAGNVKLITKYSDFSDAVMPYMYHCHISSHEDNGMMGQFIVNSKAPQGFTDNLSEQSELSISPNPSDGKFIITSAYHNLKNILVRDILGNIVLNETLHTKHISIDLTLFPKGMYHCIIEATNGLKTVKLIKQ